MADLAIGLGRLQPTFAETPLETGRLKLLLEEINLTAEGLTLLVDTPVAVDFGHEAPVMDGEFVKLAAKGGIGSAAPPQGSEEPPG